MPPILLFLAEEEQALPPKQEPQESCMTFKDFSSVHGGRSRRTGAICLAASLIFSLFPLSGGASAEYSFESLQNLSEPDLLRLAQAGSRENLEALESLRCTYEIEWKRKDGSTFQDGNWVFSSAGEYIGTQWRHLSVGFRSRDMDFQFVHDGRNSILFTSNEGQGMLSPGRAFRKAVETPAIGGLRVGQDYIPDFLDRVANDDSPEQQLTLHVAVVSDPKVYIVIGCEEKSDLLWKLYIDPNKGFMAGRTEYFNPDRSEHPGTVVEVLEEREYGQAHFFPMLSRVFHYKQDTMHSKWDTVLQKTFRVTQFEPNVEVDARELSIRPRTEKSWIFDNRLGMGFWLAPNVDMLSQMKEMSRTAAPRNGVVGDEQDQSSSGLESRKDLGTTREEIGSSSRRSRNSNRRWLGTAIGTIGVLLLMCGVSMVWRHRSRP